MFDALPAEAQFEVICRTHSLLRLFGEHPTDNISAIGRGLGLSKEQIQSIRLKAAYDTKRRGVPVNVDVKGWIWPSESEMLEHRSVQARERQFSRLSLTAA